MSTISSLSNMQINMNSMRMNQTQSAGGGADEMGKKFQQLSEAISSGDLTSAKSIYDEIQAAHKAMTGSSTSSSSSSSSSSSATNEMDKAMETLGAALESGDATAVQEAFAKVQEQMKAGGPGGPPPGGPPPGQDEMKEKFDSLAEAIESGDLSAAQEIYDEIQSMHESQESNSTQTGDDKMAAQMQALGEALATGSVSSVQSAFSGVQSLLNSFSSNTSKITNKDLDLMAGLGRTVDLKA